MIQCTEPSNKEAEEGSLRLGEKSMWMFFPADEEYWQVDSVILSKDKIKCFIFQNEKKKFLFCLGINILPTRYLELRILFYLIIAQ